MRRIPKRRLVYTPAVLILAIMAVATIGCEGLFGELPEFPANGANGSGSEACDPDSTPFGAGEGTDADPYLICTTDHFDAIAAEPDHLAARFRLVADLDYDGGLPRMVGIPDFDGEDVADELTGRIDDESALFSGVFDGNDHTISSIGIASEQPGVGLFRHVDDGGIIRDLVVESAAVTAPLSAGALVGINDGRIERCTVSDSTVELMADPGVLGGGVTGWNRSLGVVTEATSDADVIGGSLVGGIAGSNEGLIRNTTAEGTIRAELAFDGTELDTDNRVLRAVGGAVGINGGELEELIATGDVFTGDTLDADGQDGTEATGGLVGFNAGPVHRGAAGGKVNAVGSVDTEQRALKASGGLVGMNLAPIDASVATGDVSVRGTAHGETLRDAALGGGLVGQNFSTISNSHASGELLIDTDLTTGAIRGGGLVGRHTEWDAVGDALVTESYSTGAVEFDDSPFDTDGRAGGLLTTIETDLPPGVEEGETRLSHWDVDTSGIDDSDGGEGLETSGFSSGEFPGDSWDFDDVWEFGDDPNGDERPLLRWYDYGTTDF